MPVQYLHKMWWSLSGFPIPVMDRDSSVDIATRYGLDGPGDRIPVGKRFSPPVQTGPGAHPASCTMGTGSFPGVKRPEHGADHPLPPKRRGHERVELYLYSPSGPQWPVIGRALPFLFPSKWISQWLQIGHSPFPNSYRLSAFELILIE